MHKPVFERIALFNEGYLKPKFTNDKISELMITKWASVIKDSLEEFDLNKVNLKEVKMITYYFEWLEERSAMNLAEMNNNIDSFIELLKVHINSVEMNYSITEKVYNPFLRKVRYKIRVGSEYFITDDESELDIPFTFQIYPIQFIQDIGMLSELREYRINNLL